MQTVKIFSLRMAFAAVLIVNTAGCSLTETVKDFLSSTSPGDYTRDGLPKAEQRVNLFVTLNLENLKMDLARGQGEYLSSLSALLEVSPERRTEFFNLAQQQYPFLAGEDRASISHTLMALSQELDAGPHQSQ